MAMSELRFRELIDGLNSLGRKLSMGRVNEPVEFAPGDVSDLIALVREIEDFLRSQIELVPPWA
jgi:hypothetical protein